jgi:hypothetical protein
MLDKRKGSGRTASPTEVTGRAEPFPTTMEEGREGWGRGGGQNTCVRGGVVGGTGVSHPFRDRGGWGQRHHGEGVGERLHVPPICPGPPHGLGRRPPKRKESLLRLRRCRGRCRRWSGKEDQLRDGGARGRGTRGWPRPHVDGASPRVVDRWPLGTTCRASVARRATTSTLETTLATTAVTHPEPVRCRRALGGGGPKCGEEEPPGGRGGSPRSIVEHRGGSDGRSGGEAKLLEKQIVLGLRKGWKRLHAGKNGRHTIEARAQTAEEVEHEALVDDGGPEGAESVHHRLHLTKVLVHRDIILSKLTEGGLEVQDPSLAVAEELILKGTPDPVSSIVRHTDDVLKFGR